MKSYIITNEIDKCNERLDRYKPNTEVKSFIINNSTNVFVTINTIEIAEVKNESPRVNARMNRNIERVKFKQEENIEMLEIYYKDKEVFQFLVNKNRQNTAGQLLTINSLYQAIMYALRHR